MPQKRFSEQQIAFALRQADAGTTVVKICRKMGVAEATFYRWKKVYAGMGVSEIRRLKQLEDGNGKFKRLVADLTLDKTMLQDVPRKKSEARPSPRGRAPVAVGVRRLGEKSLRRRGLWAGLPSICLGARPRGLAADADQRAGASAGALRLPASAYPAPARVSSGRSGLRPLSTSAKQARIAVILAAHTYSASP